MVFGFGRIEFDGNFINLARPWTDFQPRRPVNRSSVQAESGIEQTITKFSQWFINARLNLLAPQEKAQLQRLFEYAEDGSSFTLIRDRNLGAYINFEGGINPTAAPRGLKTNDDVDGTFTRALTTDSAWYLDEGTGLMTVRNVLDQPRFPAGKYGAGIRIDGGAANKITNRISNAAWTKSSMTAATSTETLDPAGNNSNVDKLTATSASGNAFFNTSTAVGNISTFGIWLKSSTGSIDCQLSVEGTTGSTGLVIKNITVTPIWQRFSVTQDTTSYTGNLRARVLIEDNTDIIYSWFTPLLLDNAVFDGGTVGALSTSAITRGAEKLTYLSANIINRDKGTVAMWVKPSFDPTASGNPAFVFFESGDSAGGSSDFHIQFFYEGASGDRLRLRVKRDGGSSNGINYLPSVATGMTQDNFHLIGFTWDATVSNGGHINVDGAEIGSGSTNGAFNVSETEDTFAVGSKLDNSLHSNSVIDEILITKNVLTANDFAGIFNLGIGLGVPRNRWTVQLNDQVWNPRWLHSDIYDIPLLLKEVLT